MKKTNELVKSPNSTMYFPKIELTPFELEQLCVIGHVVPSWLRMVMTNPELLEEYLKEPKPRFSKSKALNQFINEHQNDVEIKADIQLFSHGSIELIDLSVKYGLYYKDIKKVFMQCLPNDDINSAWKQHKKHSQSNTSMRLYGVSHTSKVPEIEEKRKQTMINTYGVENIMKLPDVRKELRANMIKNHGVEYAYQLVNQDKINNWHDTLFNTLIQDATWINVLKQICIMNNWQYDASMFSEKQLNVHHRDFILSNETPDSVTQLLTLYTDITHTLLSYPSNQLFRLHIAGRFNRTWLRYYRKLELVDVDESSIQSYTGSSNYEAKMMNILDEHHINYIANNRKILDGKEMDFYFPDYQVGIEINPNCTHNSNEYALTSNRVMYNSYKQPNYHYQKYLKAKEKGITLIQWFSNDLVDEQFINITIPRLLSMLNGYKHRYYARKISIRKASKSEKKQIQAFIDMHHSQQNTPASEYWGFWNDDKLIAAASFKIKQNTAELKRLCFPDDTQIIGGVSKLIKSFFREHDEIQDVTSFSDNNLGNGDGYRQAGAKFIGETGPSLKYISWSDPSDAYSWLIATSWGAKKGVIAKDSGNRIFDTQSQINKYVECELKHRTDNKFGYDKIYTAGSKKWKFTR